MFDILDVVTLKKDDSETGIKKGTTGTIVYIHGNHEAYTVEFVDEDGDTIEASLWKEYIANELQRKS